MVSVAPLGRSGASAMSASNSASAAVPLMAESVAGAAARSALQATAAPCKHANELVACGCAFCFATPLLCAVLRLVWTAARPCVHVAGPCWQHGVRSCQAVCLSPPTARPMSVVVTTTRAPSKLLHWRVAATAAHKTAVLPAVHVQLLIWPVATKLLKQAGSAQHAWPIVHAAFACTYSCGITACASAAPQRACLVPDLFSRMRPHPSCLTDS